MLDQAMDPVCGNLITSGEAESGTEYMGEVYYFCSDDCKQEFEREPALYAAGANPM